jgi:hypothetical protein
MCISFGGMSHTSIFLMTLICWASDNSGQLNNGLTSLVKTNVMPNNWSSSLFQQATHIHDRTGHFLFWIKSYRWKYLSWYKIISYNDWMIELELIDNCISRNLKRNGTYHCQNVQRVSLCPGQNNTFLSRILESRTNTLQGAHLPFLVGLVSLMRDIEYREFDSNWRINSLFNIIMTLSSRRDRPDLMRFYIWSLNASTSDLSLGSEVDIYYHNQNMIAIVAVWPNVILGRWDLFSRQIEPSVFSFW